MWTRPCTQRACTRAVFRNLQKAIHLQKVNSHPQSDGWLFTICNASLAWKCLFMPWQCRRAACLGISFPLIIAHTHGRSGPHLIHASFGIPRVHNPSGISIGSAVFTQFTLECRWAYVLPLKNCPFPWDLYPIWYVVPWVHPTQHPKWHLDRLSRFCTDDCRVSLPFPP